MNKKKRYVAFTNPAMGLAGGFVLPVWGKGDLLPGSEFPSAGGRATVNGEGITPRGRKSRRRPVLSHPLWREVA